MLSIEGLEGALRILVHCRNALCAAIPQLGDVRTQYHMAIDRFNFIFYDMINLDDSINKIEDLI